jgi:hypothetical protein
MLTGANYTYYLSGFLYQGIIASVNIRQHHFFCT